MNTINIRVEGAKVALVLNGRRLIDFGWRAGDDILRALDQQLRGTPLETGVVRMGGGATVSFRTEGGTVLWINNGAMAFSAVAADMRKIHRGISGAVRKAEETDKAEQIIADNAVLFRSGAPFGLSDNLKIQSETVKHAVNDRDLRRFMPGIKSQEILGTPRLILGTPPVLERVSRLNPNERNLLRAQLAKGN